MKESPAQRAVALRTSRPEAGRPRWIRQRVALSLLDLRHGAQIGPRQAELSCEADAPSWALSYEQVREAGRIAWREAGVYRYRYDPHDDEVWFAGPGDCPGVHAWRLAEPARNAPMTGWRHASSCSCACCDPAGER